MARRTPTPAPPQAEPRLVVDWLRCRGHGVCAGLLPEMITLDDWGYPIITGTVSPQMEGVALRTAAACPALALELVAPG